MSTVKLYEEDAYLGEFTAIVEKCVSEAGIFKVVLNQTAFYPEGGGQPADGGILGSARILDVQEAGGIIFHTVTKPLEPGSEVVGKVDFERRFSNMQNHSGEHIVSGIIARKYGCHNVGFHMGTAAVTVDFDKVLTKEQLFEVEMEANDAILKDVPIRVFCPTAEELESMEYRSKKKIEGQVRLVEVEGYDRCACCGTHVAHTAEIRLIKILGVQNYKGGVRVSMLSGERAFRDYQMKHSNLVGISQLLSVKPEEAGDAVVRLKEKNIELKKEIKQMKKQTDAQEKGCHR